jgi:hypothetical protein
VRPSLCRTLTARGVLHARRQGSLGGGAGRKLRLRARWRDLSGEEANRHGERTGHDDVLARRQIWLVYSSFARLAIRSLAYLAATSVSYLMVIYGAPLSS